MDPYEHRRRKLTLDEDQETVRDSFEDFFQKEVPLTLVRAAEPTGFDPALWAKVVGVGLTAMALPEEVGGDGAGVIELALVAEQLGRVLAPVPLVEHVVASRLLAAAGDPAFDAVLEEALEGERILAFSPAPLGGRRLVSTAAVSTDVVGFDGERIVLMRSEAPRPHVANRACLPAAWVDPAAEEIQVVAADAPAELFARAVDEWSVATAAALAGLTEAALAIGAEFTKTRETQGVVIAKLQGVSFALADVHIGVQSARNLARRAAWFLDHEPGSERHLPASALVYAARVATRGVTSAAHVQGGLGFTNDANTSPYFLRAHGWSLAGGELGAARRRIAEAALAARRARRQEEPRSAAVGVGA